MSSDLKADGRGGRKGDRKEKGKGKGGRVRDRHKDLGKVRGLSNEEEGKRGVRKGQSEKPLRSFLREGGDGEKGGIGKRNRTVLWDVKGEVEREKQPVG